ncbi:MAG: hypothetical protein IIB31_00635 [Chloroflexi bacterium]|nr:hypothetical protein [Chloroflexota bacterium]MCH8896736.1 hypothetical protein [Chloroflexota bacterium]
MTISRSPENRGGANKLALYSILVIAAVAAAIIITFFVTGFESRSATGDQSGVSDLAVSSSLPLSTRVPDPTEAPISDIGLKLLAVEPPPAPRFIPEVKFGEVLAQGLVDVDLPGGAASETWYSFQVDTSTRDITLFYALYGSSPSIITRTVQINDYTQRSKLNSAEVTLYYPEGPIRTIVYDRATGIITLTQQYPQPYGPSMFTPELRVAMVNQDIVLSDEAGSISAQLQLDLSGLTDSEQIILERSAPELIDEVLSEIQDLVIQIEDKRVK